MEKVNKNNYEAFFLDYLEGSLPETQEADLLAFLEAHPNLRAELESMMDVDLKDLRLQSKPVELDIKSTLQQEVDLEELIIASVEGLLDAEEEMDLQKRIKKENAQQVYAAYCSAKLKADLSQTFVNRDKLKQLAAEAVGEKDALMIAFVQGELTPHTADQFLASLTADEQKHLAIYRKAFLQADVAIQYPNKGELKRKDSVVIPLFYRYASAAAAIILLVGLYFFNQDNANQQSSFMASADSLEKTDPKLPVNQLADKSVIETTVTETEGESSRTFVNSDRPGANDLADAGTTKDQNLKEDQNNKGSYIEDVAIEDELVNYPLDKYKLQAEEEWPVNTDETIAQNESSKSSSRPLKLFTDAAGSLLNREVFYERETNEESEVVAHHVKIGKFEFQRKK